MMRRIDSRQADAIVELIGALRLDWDKRGIVKALRDASRITTDPTRLAVAAVFAANNPTNLTPAVIAMRGKHWDALDPNRDPEPTRALRCDQCRGLHMAGSPCDPPATSRTSEHANAMRAALREARTGLCSHGIKPNLCTDHRGAA